MRVSVKMTLDDESEFKAQVEVVELSLRCLIAWSCEAAKPCQPLVFPVTLKYKRGICLRDTTLEFIVSPCPNDEAFHHDGHQSFGCAVTNLESPSDGFAAAAFSL